MVLLVKAVGRARLLSAGVNGEHLRASIHCSCGPLPWPLGLPPVPGALEQRRAIVLVATAVLPEK